MNRSQLSLYTFANYLPLLSKIILYPLLISKLGSGLWVLIASMDAFFNIYSLLVEYGFAINGIKTLSDRKINYDNKIKFVSKTIFTQIALFIIFLLPFLALSFVFFEKEIIKNYFTYFAIYFFLFTCKPVWILKGFKQFFTLSLAHFISNITLLLGVLFFVQESSDFLIFLILRIVSIAFYYLIAIKKLKEVRFYIKYFNEIIPSIKQSFDYFLSRLSGVFNTNFINSLG